MAPSNQVLSSLPFEAFDESVPGVMGDQLTGGADENASDNLLKWAAPGQEYIVFWKDLSGSWLQYPEITETTNTIRPGEGFWIVSRQASTQQIYLSGTVILDASNAVAIPPALSLFSYPFSSKLGLNESLLAADGAFGAESQTNADEITETAGNEQFWLLDDTNSPFHGQWVDATTNLANLDLSLGQGYWFNRKLTNGFVWTESRPYADLFPSDDSPPVVTSMTFNAPGTEVTLGITSTGTGERLEIYFKDLTATGALVSAPGLAPAGSTEGAWQIAELNLISSGGSVSWLDDGSGGRGAINTVFARFYLVGTGFDEDGDGLPSGRELFVYGSNPQELDTDGDGMPDGWEVQHFLNPLINDADGDVDLDELTNLEEYLNNTDPNNADTDGDGLPDGWEVNNGLNPRSDLVTSGLVSHWAFDDGGGAVATNSVSTNYAGNLQNFDGGGWTTGLLGGALSFDGADDVVSVTQSVAIITGQQFTIAGLVNLSSDFGTNTPTLISDAKARADDFPVAVTGVPGGWFGGVVTGSGTTNPATDGSANWSVPSSGNHLNRALFGGAGSATNSAKQRNSYITKPVSLLAATGNRPQEWAFNISYDSSDTTGASGVNRLRVWLWADSTNLSTANGYAVEYGEDGTNDTVRLFRMSNGSKVTPAVVSAGTPVQAGDVQFSVRVQRSPVGVWALWSVFNVATNNAFPVADPRTVTNNLKQGTNNLVAVGGDSHVAFQCFISTSASSTRRLALDDLFINGQITGFELRHRDTLTALMGDETNTVVASALRAESNQWQALALRYDGTNATLFVDGVASALRAESFSPALATELLIGRSISEPTNSSLKGKVDDLRIYDAALSDQDIRDLYDRVVDADGDGVSNYDEFVAGTDPNDAASKPVSISGIISYVGNLTGGVWVTASPSAVGFPLDRSTVIAAPGAFTIPNVPTLNHYWLRAFRDGNSDQTPGACEPRGEYAGNALYLTGAVSGITITLADDSVPPVLSGVPEPVIIQAGNIPAPADVTANDAYEGSVSVTFGATTNDLPAFNLYVGSVGQGLNGYFLTGFTNALKGFGSRSLETFSGIAVSPPNYSNLTVELDGIACTIEHRDDDGTLEGTLRTYFVEDPVSQDGATGSGPGIDENTGSSGNRNMFIFRFSGEVGHVGLDGLDIESSSTGTLATLRAYDADSNLLFSTGVEYPNGDNGNGQVHFIGLTSERADIRIATLTVGDHTAGGGNNQHMAFDNLRFGSSTAPDYEIVRTWSAADSCGNGITATQYIYVVETTDPNPSLPPIDFEVDLSDLIWINEIHYDNVGADVGEGVEIAGPMGAVLTNHSLVFYSGANGKVYKTAPLSGTISSQQCSYGTAWFPVSGIENGPADGIALVKGAMAVKQFLSYEGVLVGVNGPAVGLTSTPISVSESASTPVGQSLQLIGTGGAYGDFVWTGPTKATPGNVNTNQVFPCPEDGPSQIFKEPNAWPLTLNGNPVTYDEFIEAPRLAMAENIPYLEAQMLTERLEAEAWCASNGAPILAETEEGVWISVFKIENGDPVYHIGCNRTAARTVSTDKVWPNGGAGFNLTGTNTIIGLWEVGGIPRSTHQEFVQAGTSRIVFGDDNRDTNNHATWVAGTIGAAGVSTNRTGMSFRARILAHDSGYDRAEMQKAALTNNVRISNHSYVSGSAGWTPFGGIWRWYGNLSLSTRESSIFGHYGFFAAAIDDTVYSSIYLLPVFAAGNKRLFGPATQPVLHEVAGSNGWEQSTLEHDLDGGPNGFDSIYAEPLAKNCLAVGSVHDIPNGYSGPSSVSVVDGSGWGPSDDGRIKPDIMGNGQTVSTTGHTGDNHYVSVSGTSLAAANVSGSLNLLIELHRQYYGSNIALWASTVKALAIHTADECGPAPGPDYMYGWGLLNTRKAAELIRTNALSAGLPHIKQVVLLNHDDIQFAVTNAGGTSNPLRVTIAWTDPAGTPQPHALDPTNLVLVNDLDLRVIGPGPNGPTNYPWVLNPNSPTSAATKADNFRDNVEQVHIAAPTAGWYTVKITHKGSLSNGYQNVSIVISGNRPQPPPVLRVSDFMIYPAEHRYIEWPAIVGGVYRIEELNDLMAGSWTSHVADVSAAKTNLILRDFPIASTSSRYYRVRAMQ